MARNFEGMLDAMLDGVVLLDSKGEVEVLNPEACRILDTSAETALGLSIEDMLGADHSIAKLSRTVLASGRAAIEREHLVEQRRTAAIAVDVAASPLLEGDRVDGVALMLRDCTIQQSLRDLVAQREALSSFGRIAAGIAHEVNTPVGIGITAITHLCNVVKDLSLRYQAGTLSPEDLEKLAVYRPCRLLLQMTRPE